MPKTIVGKQVAPVENKALFDDKGLVPAIIQGAHTKQVLMLGYMNEESLKRTLTTGHVWFYSRSRQELWEKGGTSGNFLNVKRVQIDCDNDAVLVQAEPDGPTCHTGAVACWFTDLQAEGLKAGRK